MFHKAVYVLLFLFLLYNQGQTRVNFQNETEIREIRNEIVLLNLLRGLYLTIDQKSDIVYKIEEAEQVREEFIMDWEQLRGMSGDVLLELKNVLANDQEIPDELKRRVHQTERAFHELEDKCGKNLLELEAELKDILNDNQILVIETYKPCLIPPAQGRIGQSMENRGVGIVRLLQRVRNMPSERFFRVRNDLADMHIERVERHSGKLNKEEKAGYRKRMLRIYDKARQLSDKEFFLQQAELVDQCIPDKEMTYPKRENRPGRIGKFLLDPALKPYL